MSQFIDLVGDNEPSDDGSFFEIDADVLELLAADSAKAPKSRARVPEALHEASARGAHSKAPAKGVKRTAPPPPPPHRVPIIDVDQEFELVPTDPNSAEGSDNRAVDADLELVRRLSSALGDDDDEAEQRSQSRSNSNATNAKAPAAAAPAKKRKSKTDEEKVGEFQIMCHGDLLVGARGDAFRAGVAASQFPVANVGTRNAMCASCVSFFSTATQTVAPHVVAVVQAHVLWEFIQDLTREGHAHVQPLCAWAGSIAQHESVRGRKVTLFVEEMDRFATKWVASENRRKAANAPPKRKENCVEFFDEAAVVLQTLFGWNVRHFVNATEMGQALGKIARVIALHHNSEEGADAADPFHFHLESAAGGRGKKCNDAREVWTGMLMAVPGISRPRAAAIVQAYPSAKALLSAYRSSAHDTQYKQGLLKELSVPGAKKDRKLGPVLSARVHMVLTSRDPLQLVGTAAPDK